MFGKRIVNNLGILSIVVLIFFIVSTTNAFASNVDRNALESIELLFQTKARNWGIVLQDYALTLFRYLLIGSVAWMGIRLALEQAELKSILIQFIKLVFNAALMLAVLFNYKQWAGMLINGLSTIGQELGAPPLAPNSIFNSGLEIINNIVGELSIVDPIDSLALIICAIVIMICFALIAAQVLLVKCEAYIVLNAGTILLGFGGSDITRNYATNFLKYSLTVAMKLFVMQLLVSLGISFIQDLQEAKITIDQILVLIGVSVVLFALVNTIPDIISGIVNGSHVSTGQAITSAVSAVSMGTMATMGAMKASGFNAFDGVQATRAAAGMANADGVSGLGKAGHMAKNLGSAALSTRGQGRVQNIRSAVQGKSELQDLMNSGETSYTPPMEDKPYESPAVDLTENSSSE